MAARIEPSKGSKPDKIIKSALILELNRMAEDEDGKKIKKVNRIVASLVRSAMEGKIDAIREVFDRVEGKASQAVEVSGGLQHVVFSIEGAKLPKIIDQSPRPMLEVEGD